MSNHLRSTTRRKLEEEVAAAAPPPPPDHVAGEEEKEEAEDEVESSVWQISEFQTLAQTQQLAKELQILIALYESTTTGITTATTTTTTTTNNTINNNIDNSNNWYNTNGWYETGITPCNWYGIICNKENYIIQIQFQNNNLIGTLPISMLYELSNLQYIDLSDNPKLMIDFRTQVTVVTTTTVTTAPNNNNYYLNDTNSEYPPPVVIIVSKQATTSTSIATTNTTNTTNSSIQYLNISNTATNELVGIASVAESLQVLDISTTSITMLSYQDLGQLKQLTNLYMNDLYLMNNNNNDDNNNQSIGVTIEELIFPPFNDNNNNDNNNNTSTESSSLSLLLPFQNLQVWYASHSNLIGTIPSFLQYPERILKLHTIDWSHNYLSGTIPNNNNNNNIFLLGIENPTLPFYFNLHNNSLSGNFKNIIMSSSSTSSTTTSSTSTINRFTSLFLDITANQLTGEIPMEICLHNNWMNGTVQEFGCNAIACPVGTYRVNYGRQINNDVTRCRDCSTSFSTTNGVVQQQQYLGQITCNEDNNNDIDELIDVNNNNSNNDNMDGPIMAAEYEPNQDVEAQLRALSVFYEATDGPNWFQNDGWMVPADVNNNNNNINNNNNNAIDFCQWFGVSCARGLVRELYLPNNNLQGTTPASIFPALSSLRRVFLQDNPNLVVDFSGFSSSIVTDTSLPDLEDLILSRTATVSLEGISSAFNLVHLDVNATKLSSTSNMSDVFTLSKLRTINLGNNQLNQNIPDTIVNLSNLVSLRAQNAGFIGTLPASLSELKKLVVLDLSKNNIVGPIPAESLNSLTELRILDLHEQRIPLGGPLHAFDGLPSLLQLDLSANAMTGTIQPKFLNGINDKFRKIDVNLTSNKLRGNLPLELALFQSLNIDVTENQIVSVPQILCIKEEWMDGLVARFGCDSIMCPPGTSNDYGRMISEETPCRVCPEDVLLFFGAKGCSADTPKPEATKSPTMSPSLAKEEDNLTQREILELFFEATNGEVSWLRKENWLEDDIDICSWFGVSCGDDSQVESLVLSENGLEGKTPPQLFQLNRLTRLFLDGNKKLEVDLTNIPATSKLRAVVISDTATSSARGIGKASLLQVLDLNATKVGREAIDEIVSLRSLQSLNLGNTRLDRALPIDLDFADMREFVAPNSGITGIIPTSFGVMTGLAVLDLCNNNIGGVIPESFMDLTGLRIIDLHGQDVAKGGGIQGQLLPFDNLRTLNKMDLSANRLSGSIPESFLSGIADKAASLDVNLSDNLLFGSLPVTLSSFLELNIDVTANLISSIPESLCSKDLWMNGNVMKFGCNAILCPPGTHSPPGRQIVDSQPCEECATRPNPFYGSLSCSAFLGKENDTSICPSGDVCYNAGVCYEAKELQPDSPSCECNGTTEAGIPFAGVSCEYKATDICHLGGFGVGEISSFCTNNGRCKERVETGSPHQGCECNTDVWEGEYCELRKGFIQSTQNPTSSVVDVTATPTQTQAPIKSQTCPDGHICQNGGKCVQAKEDGPFSCDCIGLGLWQLPFAGDQCQFPATSLCNLSPPYTSFCVNGGACVSLVEAGSEHGNCTCPFGFSGKFCHVSRFSDPGMEAQDQYIPSSSDSNMEPWQMSLVFTLPALAIVIIVAVIVVAYSIRGKSNVKFVNADQLNESEYDKYMETDEVFETPRAYYKDSGYSDLETPPSILDRALAEPHFDSPSLNGSSPPFDTTSNGTAFFSLPLTLRNNYSDEDEDDDVPATNGVGPVKGTDSLESPTTSISRSSDTEDSPESENKGFHQLPVIEEETQSMSTPTQEVTTATASSFFYADANKSPEKQYSESEVPSAPDTTRKSVRIDDTPQIVTFEEKTSFSGDEEGKTDQKVKGNEANKHNDGYEDEERVVKDEKSANARQTEILTTTEESMFDASPVAAADEDTDESSEEELSDFIGDIEEEDAYNRSGGSSGAVGKSLFSGVQNDDSVSFLDHSVEMSDDSDKSTTSESEIPRVQVAVSPSLAQTMFGGREASETSSGELSLNF